jgi:hypothetical protein
LIKSIPPHPNPLPASGERGLDRVYYLSRKNIGVDRVYYLSRKNIGVDRVYYLSRKNIGIIL